MCRGNDRSWMHSLIFEFHTDMPLSASVNCELQPTGITVIHHWHLTRMAAMYFCWCLWWQIIAHHQQIKQLRCVFVKWMPSLCQFHHRSGIESSSWANWVGCFALIRNLRDSDKNFQMIPAGKLAGEFSVNKCGDRIFICVGGFLHHFMMSSKRA